MGKIDRLKDDHNEKKKKRFDQWLKTSTEGVKPLFSPAAVTEAAIEKELKSLLKQAIKDSMALDDHSIQIGRIIVHGFVPHLVWSRSEAYRPIYFFFGKVDDTCKGCAAGKSQFPLADQKFDDPRTIVSRMWKKLVFEKIKDGQVPLCWPETFLVCPDLPPPPRGCKYYINRNNKKLTWSIRDVLALSRLRIPQWAIRKREILGTPGASVRTNRRIFYLLDSGYFKTEQEAGSIVSVAMKAHENSETYREKYVNTFACDAWEKALVWDSTKREALKQIIISKPDGLKFDDISEFGPLDAQKIGRAHTEWKGKKEKWEEDDYHWLNTECCAFAFPVKEKPGFQTFQTMYGCEDIDGHLLIYFEVFLKTKAYPNKNKGQIPIKITEMNADKLVAFCHNVLLPWVRLFREADKRWENGQKFNLLFPRDMRLQLLGSIQDVEAEINAISGNSFTDKLTRVELYYKRRAHKEEDEPVQLALSAMSDFWGFAFDEVIKPQYFEFQRFQQLLKGIPDYRDHLTHSIEVFLLGNQIVDKVLNADRKSKQRLCARMHSMKLFDFIKGLKVEKIVEVENKIIRLQWALAALIHDFAIPAEKANDLVNHMFQTFLGVKANGQVGSDGLKEVFAQEQTKYRTIIYTLFSKTQTGAEAVNTLGDPMLSEFAFQRLAEDHGFLSAVYLFNQLFERTKTGWWNLKKSVHEHILKNTLGDGWDKGGERFTEILVLEVLDAIVKHNAFAKEYRMFFTDGPSYKFPDQFFSASQSIYQSPIPGLLLLCDTLCDWGRMIHPDELRHHETGRGKEEKQPEIVRPECQITKIEEKNGKTQITVTYRWRLPYFSGIANREKCLQDIYTFIIKDMWPYAPGFSMWECCQVCTPNPKNCKAVQIICRYWSQVIAAEGSNRLQFPKLWSPFNNITIKVKFYDDEICNFQIGKGVSKSVSP